MSDYITVLQTEIDKTKQKLAAIDEYATLSGLSVLPADWIVDPYVNSVQTGISPEVNESGDVTKFRVEYKVNVKKHYIDEKPCLSESNSTLAAQCSLVSGSWKPPSEFSESEKTAIAEQAKIDTEIEKWAIKQAELDFFNGTLDYILKEDKS